MKLISTEQTDIFLLTPGHAKDLQRFLLANRTHFAPFEPLRNEDYFSISHIRERINNAQHDYQARTSLQLVFTLQESDRIIGSVNFTNFIFGVFQACYLGFSLDQGYQGRGLMQEVLKKSIGYVKENYGIHRIMANHLPENQRSANTLQSLGFVKEGYAHSYLKINGEWQDHVLNSLIMD